MAGLSRGLWQKPHSDARRSRSQAATLSSLRGGRVSVRYDSVAQGCQRERKRADSPYALIRERKARRHKSLLNTRPCNEHGGTRTEYRSLRISQMGKLSLLFLLPWFNLSVVRRGGLLPAGRLPAAYATILDRLSTLVYITIDVQGRREGGAKEASAYGPVSNKGPSD
ncbi:hypothetical protein ANN_06257 [Periplaneta americana]|uniref:Uncharacterized protein n=1 Tax=Periplaneta americana TaxID=6978 RepID=A0ABQ8TFJ2_PERAM|nr:hypothetical protein ANN_06257 [Periplaneta americana]